MALQPALMVMSGPHCPEVCFTSDQKIVETPKAPHHSSVYIEDQSHTQIMLPTLELHDPIAHALEESYMQANMRDTSCLCLIHFLACHSQECAYDSNLHVVSHNTVVSPRTISHALALTYVLWAVRNTKCGCLHCYIFLAYWFA